ncbi:MAG TPA: pyrroline-5-carboxylate reductase [Gammaproteobacteria bacterium]|nr:pyrroline-5-carboxylate reductase [Gammaproteobacteria bacterium]
MKSSRISFIGAGNMARSLIGGLIADGWNAASIQVADADPEPARRLAACFGITVAAGNREAVADTDMLVLAVKPQVMHPVAAEIAPAVHGSCPLVVSIAAGIRSDDLHRWLGGHCPVVRCMPNTPALVQSGATALYARPDVSEAQRELAETLLRAVGLTLWVDDENLMDAVTALSGSGPAYVFLVIEAMQSAGVKLGLPPDAARLLALQTVFGAAKMALESPEEAAVLRRRVTSPGGTTERALTVLKQGGLGQLFQQAMKAARDRSRELAGTLGET